MQSHHPLSGVTTLSLVLNCVRVAVAVFEGPDTVKCCFRAKSESAHSFGSKFNTVAW